MLILSAFDHPHKKQRFSLDCLAKTSRLVEYESCILNSVNSLSDFGLNRKSAKAFVSRQQTFLPFVHHSSQFINDKSKQNNPHDVMFAAIEVKGLVRKWLIEVLEVLEVCLSD